MVIYMFWTSKLDIVRLASDKLMMILIEIMVFCYCTEIREKCFSMYGKNQSELFWVSDTGIGNYFSPNISSYNRVLSLQLCYESLIIHVH